MELAIIIPAYKDTFLRQALDSIAAQTCQEFTLYIGDDCSPYDIGSIVDEYKDNIDLVYKRFDTNLGGKDLVAQWERCIEMSQEEPYIWLFSDDDVMEPMCVEDFYKEINGNTETYDLYHFDVKKIDEKGEVLSEYLAYPQGLDSYNYYVGKLRARYVSLVVENIFTREIYETSGGFKKFDLAWGSDTATWAIFSAKKRFRCIQGSRVLWRSSSQNITPNVSQPIAIRKMDALLRFLEWGYGFYKNMGKSVFWTNVRAYINRMSKYHQYIPSSEFKRMTRKFCSIHHCGYLYWPLYLFIKSRKR